MSAPVAPAPSPSAAGGALDGIVVADFSRVLAGPYCTMLLADLGADVVKVESPAGDDTRHWVPPTRGDIGTYYLAINRNKRSIVLDLADADDLAVAHALSARADITIQNFRPGGLRKFGLDYDVGTGPQRVHHLLLDLGFGAGKGASLPGYDLLAQAVSGLMSLTGSPDGPPYRAGISVFDVMTGLHSAIGILAALHHRDVTGEGQHIETNLLSTALSALVNQTSAYVAGGVVPRRMGNAHLSLFPYEPLADRRRRADRHRRQRPPVPQAHAALDIARGRRRRAIRDRRGAQRQPRAAAADPARAAGHPLGAGVVRRADRGRHPVRTDQRRARQASSWPTELGLEPVVMTDDVPTVRNPIRMSADPTALRPCRRPALDEHGDDDPGVARHGAGTHPYDRPTGLGPSA